MILDRYFIGSLFLFLLSINYAQITPTQLECEYMNNPGVVDELKPRLSWVNISNANERNQSQSAYQIKVASNILKLSNPDIWNSGKINSSASNRIQYNGIALKSRMTCYWQVRVWDKNNNPSAWSKPAQWHMGILNQNEWKAEWIGAPWQGEEYIPTPPGGPQSRTKILPPNAPLLRKSFSINKKIKSAVVYTTGLGYFEFYTNGTKVSDDLLVPNQTNYDKRPHLVNSFISLPDSFRDYHVMYLAYDITAKLRLGKNAIGAILGNGFYNAPKFWTASYGSPRFIAQLHITYTDGTEDIIATDLTWKANKSAILSDLVYDGEIYDARLENNVWCNAAYDDSQWEPVIKRKTPYGRLIAHTAPTDKVTKQYNPLKIEKLPNGNIKVQFEEEISGWVRFKKIIGPSGHKIKINFNSNNFSGENIYTFNGKLSDYAPRFNWFVFNSIEIENWPGGNLNASQIIAEAVNTDIKQNAEFETSNTLFNQINKIWQRSQLDNTHGGIASDCPHRERSGYTGDAQVVCQTVMHNFDTRAFYKKWLRDILGAQTPSTGYIPNGAPWQPGCGGGVPWGAAIHIIPWEYFLHYGDREILASNYEGMTGYIKYMSTWVNDEGIMYSQRLGKDSKPLKWWNLGEWAGLDSMPPDPLVHTFYYWLCADITSKVALILFKLKDAEYYGSVADKTRKVFLSTYYNQEKGQFGKFGANIFALKMGVHPDQYQPVINALKKDITKDSGHFDTGIFGTRYFFEVLAENGMQDLAYDAMNKTTFPSFGSWLAAGSTTTREQWDNSGSHNHPMFGGGLIWFYNTLAGMKTHKTTSGFKKITFKPMPAQDLKYAKYYTNTVYGKAGIEWKIENGFTMKLTVPVGATAEVHLPLKYGTQITENKEPIAQFKVLHEDAQYKVLEIGSGIYQFQIR